VQPSTIRLKLPNKSASHVKGPKSWRIRLFSDAEGAVYELTIAD
jgi:hypothetical protein